MKLTTRLRCFLLQKLQRNVIVHMILSPESQAIVVCWDCSCSEMQCSLLVVRCPNRDQHSLFLLLQSTIKVLPPSSQALTSDAPLHMRLLFVVVYFCFLWFVRAPTTPLGLFVWFRFACINIRLYFLF